LLGFETRMQVDDFLKEHEVYDFTVGDFEQDSLISSTTARRSTRFPVTI
jgi:hypothetical protein